MTHQKVKASQVHSFVTRFLKERKRTDGKTVEVLITKNELTIRLDPKKSQQKKNTETASGWGLIPLDRETAKFIAEDIELEYDT
ncbi:hypothetical protein L0337_19695 [candidate division KSB1 bacterium]|nr:hypothetical protein [candidate division KSB1 bacterium]